MKKRVLMAATVPSMIGQFNMDNIQILLKMGFIIDVVADFTDTSVWPLERTQKFINEMSNLGIDCIQSDFSRNPFKIQRHFQAYKSLVKLINERKYSFIHTHTPIASAIIRQAANKCNCRVIYTAHGFHFYKGAPLKNWLLFFPIEKFFSRYTDVLITINNEDFVLANKRMSAKKITYVPGVGIDINKFAPSKLGREKIRKELGIDSNQIMLLSVGELNDNKNHLRVVEAIQGLENIVYVIAGRGDLKNELEHMAKEKKVSLKLVGFRNDVSDFYDAADIYILPSIREGLNMSLMEAMAKGLAVSCGRIRGNVDLIDDEGCLFNPKNISEIRNSIVQTIELKEKCAMVNKEKILHFDKKIVSEKMRKIYSELCERL